MTISEYLRQEGLSQAELARRLGVSRSAVGQWLHGATLPSGRTAIAIVRVTEGKVRFEDIYRQHRHAAWVPFGCVRRDGRLYRDPEVWFLCCQVVDLHDQGMSWQAIAERLERVREPPPDTGTAWNAAAVQALFENHAALQGLAFPDEADV